MVDLQICPLTSAEWCICPLASAEWCVPLVLGGLNLSEFFVSGGMCRVSAARECHEGQTSGFTGHRKGLPMFYPRWRTNSSEKLDFWDSVLLLKLKVYWKVWLQLHSLAKDSVLPLLPDRLWREPPTEELTPRMEDETDKQIWPLGLGLFLCTSVWPRTVYMSLCLRGVMRWAWSP